MALSALTVSKCARVAGGLKRIVIIDKDDVGSVSFNGSAHQVDDIVDTAGTASVNTGVEFTFRRNEARFEYSSERNDNGVDSCTINVFSSVPAPNAAQLHAIEALRDTCELIVVVQEFGDNTPLRVFGCDTFEFGTMEYQGATHNSGTNRTETNMLELNLQGEQEELPYVLAGLTLGGESGGSIAGNDGIMNHLIGS